MLVEAFPKLQNAKIVRVLRAYFSSVWNVVVIAFIMTLSAVFSLEVAAGYCYLAIAVLVCLFAEDMLGTLPAVMCVPMILSIPNNVKNFSETIFSDPASMIQLGFCAAVAFVLLLGRLVSMLLAGRGRRGVPRLTVGFLLLLVVYLLGGLLSPYYSTSSVLLGLLQWLSIGLAYFFFFYTVDWRKVPKGYIAGVFAVLGFALTVQILNMYFQSGAVVNGVVDRDRLFPGWGTYNNIGCLTAMCIPAVFYFAATQKHGWIFTLLATAVMAGVVLSQSRGSILFGGIIYLASAVIVIVKSSRRERTFHLIVFALVVIVLAVCWFVFSEKLQQFFSALFEKGMDDAGRKELFEEAWNYFLKYPVFGVGWGGEKWAEGVNLLQFFMAHNTFLQVLGSFGVVGMLAYLVHRIQTLRITFRRFNVEKCFTGLIILTMLLCCMVDVHIFIVETALHYSILLVCLEGIDKREVHEEPSADFHRRHGRKKKEKQNESDS